MVMKADAGDSGLQQTKLEIEEASRFPPNRRHGDHNLIGTKRGIEFLVYREDVFVMGVSVAGGRAPRALMDSGSRIRIGVVGATTLSQILKVITNGQMDQQSDM